MFIPVTETDMSALYNVKVPSAGVVSMPRRKKVDVVHNASRYVIEGRKTAGLGGTKRTEYNV